MAIDYDATPYFGSAESTDATDITVACTPTSAPGAVVVYCHSALGTSDQVVSATYGGVAMTEVTGSPLLKSATENMSTHCFFLGAGIPTGAQNLVVDRSGANSMFVDVMIFSASLNCEVVDSDTVTSDSTANPTTPALSLGGRTCAVLIGFGSGQSAVTGISPLANWTARAEHDGGAGSASQVSGLYTYDIISTADVTPGWTQTADDANGFALAISEVAAATQHVSTGRADETDTAYALTQQAGPMLSARTSSGVAPLLVYFNAITDPFAPVPADNDTGDPDPALFNYQWHFGDDPSAIFLTTLKSKNRATSPVVAHAFEDAGVYTVSRRIETNTGKVYLHTETITVTAPTSTWATPGTNKFWVDNTLGDDTYDGSQATHGAGLVGPWKTMTKALSTTGMFSVASSWLIVAGNNTYAETAHSQIANKAGPYLISWDGVGTEPEVQLSSGIQCLNCAGTTFGVRMMDFHITGTDNQVAIIPGNDSVYVRVVIDSVSSACEVSGTLRTGSGLVECEFGDSIVQYCFYADVIDQFACIGCIFDSGGVSGEYTVRNYATRSFYGHCKFNGGGAGKGTLRLAGFFPTGHGSRNGFEPTEAAEYNCVQDCICDDPSGTETFLWQIGSCVDTNDARVGQNTIVERCLITAGAATSKCIENDSGKCFTYRNNVGIVTASPDAELLQVQRSGAASTLPIGNQAYNNTTVCNTTYTGVGIQIGTDPENTVVQNNAVFSTSASCGDADGVSNSAGAETTITTNLVYDITGLASIATGRPSDGHTCFDDGTATGYVKDDFDGDGLFSTRNATGAFEDGTPVLFEPVTTPGGHKAPVATRPGRAIRYSARW